MSVRSMKVGVRSQRLVQYKRRVSDKIEQMKKEKEELMTTVENYYETAIGSANDLLRENSEQRFFEPSMYQRSMAELEACCEKLFLLRMNLLEQTEGSDAEDEPFDGCSSMQTTSEKEAQAMSMTLSWSESLPEPSLVTSLPENKCQSRGDGTSYNNVPLPMPAMITPLSSSSSMCLSEKTDPFKMSFVSHQERATSIHDASTPCESSLPTQLNSLDLSRTERNQKPKIQETNLTIKQVKTEQHLRQPQNRLPTHNNTNVFTSPAIGIPIPEVPYSPPMQIKQRTPVFNEECLVVVSHTTTPSDFFVQYNTEETAGVLQVFRLRFNSHNAVPIPANHEPVIFGFYLAQFGSEDTWYRVQILNIGKQTKSTSWCLVFYVDYGNSSLVSVRNLAILDEDLMAYPPLAIHCALSRIQPLNQKSWTSDQIKEFKTLCVDCSSVIQGALKDRLVSGKSCERPSPAIEAQYSIELSLEFSGISLNVSDYMVERHLAYFPSTSCNIFEVTEETDQVCAQFPGSVSASQRDFTTVGSVDNKPAGDLTPLPKSPDKFPLVSKDQAEFTPAMPPIHDLWNSVLSVQEKQKRSDSTRNSEDESPSNVNILSAVTTVDTFKEKGIVEKSTHDLWNLVLGVKGSPKAVAASTLRKPMSSASNEGAVKKVPKPNLVEKYSLADYSANLLPNPFLNKWPAGRVSALISVMDNPKNFHVHLINESTHLIDDLEDRMNAHYNTEQSPVPVLPSVAVAGTFWASRFPSDQQWYRVIVKKVLDSPTHIFTNQESKVLLNFVDWGNDLEASRSDLRPLLPKFCEIPCLAVPCSLAWICPLPGEEDWSSEAINRMIELTGQDKILSLRVERQQIDNKRLEVILWTSDENEDELILNHTLVQEGLVATSSATGSQQSLPKNHGPTAGLPDENLQTEKVTSCSSSLRSASLSEEMIQEIDVAQLIEEVTVPPPEIPAAETYVYANVSSIFDPAHFYLVFPYGCCSYQDVQEHGRDDEKTLEDLSIEMTLFYDEQELSDDFDSWTPEVNTYVAVRSCIHDQWLRATILQHNKNHTKFEVFCVDFGIEESVSRCSIRQIKREFAKMPAQAVECFMKIAPMNGQGWSAASQEVFEDYVKGEVLLARILSGSGEEAVVSLFKSDGVSTVDLGMTLVEQQLARQVDGSFTLEADVPGTKCI